MRSYRFPPQVHSPAHNPGTELLSTSTKSLLRSDLVLHSPLVPGDGIALTRYLTGVKQNFSRPPIGTPWKIFPAVWSVLMRCRAETNLLPLSKHMILELGSKDNSASIQQILQRQGEFLQWRIITLTGQRMEGLFAKFVKVNIRHHCLSSSGDQHQHL